MPNKFQYAKRAANHLKKIYLDTAQEWGIAQADSYESSLKEALQLLADNPDMGRTCDHIRKGYRRHEHKHHIIFYRKQEDGILVMSVIHESRDIERLFQ